MPAHVKEKMMGKDTKTLLARAEAMADQINEILKRPRPVLGTSQNGYFGGYGCRWCKYSRAWFVVLPFEEETTARKIGDVFTEAGAKVTIGNEAGLAQSQGGRGLQVSAYVN